MKDHSAKKNIIEGLLNRQQFLPEELDYNLLEKKKQLLQELATTGNSAISIFDMYRKEHVFYSSNYSALFGYRILKADRTYVRVIEQDQILAFDPHGNMWLSLGIIDIAPNQGINEGLKSQVVNFKTGALLQLRKESNGRRSTSELTPRETEVLKMIRDGFLSKEISGKLAISIFTVNTHRQRILEKLNANNAMEAVSLATGLGIL